MIGVLSSGSLQCLLCARRWSRTRRTRRTRTTRQQKEVHSERASSQDRTKRGHPDCKEQEHWRLIEDIRERRPCDLSASETGNRTQKVAGSIHRKHNRTMNNNRIGPKNLPSLSSFSANSVHDGSRCWATITALTAPVVHCGPRGGGEGRQEADHVHWPSPAAIEDLPEYLKHTWEPYRVYLHSPVTLARSP